MFSSQDEIACKDKYFFVMLYDLPLVFLMDSCNNIIRLELTIVNTIHLSTQNAHVLLSFVGKIWVVNIFNISFCAFF